MKKALLLLVAASSLVAVGCNGSGSDATPMKDTASTPRPAPGTATKDVMVNDTK